MDDSMRRMLTEEILKECWHEFVEETGCIPSCPKCGSSKLFPWIKNRTFTTWQDLGDLKDRIVEMGKWEDFHQFAFSIWMVEECGRDKRPIVNKWDNWLLNPTRFFELVATWWEEREVKG